MGLKISRITLCTQINTWTKLCKYFQALIFFFYLFNVLQQNTILSFSK